MVSLPVTGSGAAGRCQIVALWSSVPLDAEMWQIPQQHLANHLQRGSEGNKLMLHTYNVLRYEACYAGTCKRKVMGILTSVHRC